MRDVIVRLRQDHEMNAPISEAATHHGDLRARHGYTVAMAVEESRLLQVSIFTICTEVSSSWNSARYCPQL